MLPIEHTQCKLLIIWQEILAGGTTAFPEKTYRDIVVLAYQP
jgi:hypothetical protein